MAYEQLMIWKHPFVLLVSVLISMILIAGIQSLGPTTEGWLFPVAKAYDVKVTVEDPDHTIINGKMKKYRQCDFLALEAMMVGPTGQTVSVPLEVRETIKLRPTGEFEWGPWRLTLPIWQVEAQLIRVRTYHQCHPLYKTVTIFYENKIQRSTPAFEAQ